MRARISGVLLSAALMFGAGAASAQWSPAGPLTFQQGSTNNEVFFELPAAVTGFGAAAITVRYSALVFEPLELLPGDIAGLAPAVLGTPYDWGAGLAAVEITIPNGGALLDLPAGGRLFGARFNVLVDDGIPGNGNDIPATTTVYTDVLANAGGVVIPGMGWFPGDDVDLGTFSVDVNITPVPEPGTWALMLAGLGLVGGLAARRRSMPSSRA